MIDAGHSGNRDRSFAAYGAETEHRKGLACYLTLYLALTLSAILPLVFVLIKGARMNAAGMRMESMAHIAENAVLSEFHILLHERYDLFAVDTSYGGDSGVLTNTEKHFKSYLERNASREGSMLFGTPVDLSGMRIDSALIPEARFMCDNNAQAVREQVYAYMTADPAGSAVGRILVSADQWKGLEISGREWKSRTEKSGEEVLKALQSKREEAQQDVEDKQDNNENISDTEWEAASPAPSEPEEMVQNVRSFQFLPVLHQVLGADAVLSEVQIAAGEQLSLRDVHLGSGLQAENRHGYPRADELIFDTYVMEKTGNFTRMRGDGKLRYQTEYILCGKDTDKGNLEAVAERLLLIREGANCLYLFADEGRMGQVHAVAAVVSLILLNPELEDTLANALALAWSYLESVQDVRSLLAGYKVPLQKTGESWQTALYELLAPGEAIRDRGGDTGFGYEEYLQGLLFLEGSTIKTKRTMDIMEMDVREITHNKSFQLDRCLDTIRIEAQASSLGVQYSYAGTAGYN